MLADSWCAIEAEPLERTHSTARTRTVPVPVRDPFGYALPGAVGVGLLVAAGGIAVSCRRGFDRQRLERRLEKRRYAEWISTGTVTSSLPETRIAVDSLEGLVDVAIDTDSRVIHDEEHGVYVVTTDSVVYHYVPDG